MTPLAARQLMRTIRPSFDGGTPERDECRLTLGYLIAAVTAVNNLHTPVIPILCVSLVGVGAVVGSINNRQPA